MLNKIKFIIFYIFVILIICSWQAAADPEISVDNLTYKPGQFELSANVNSKLADGLTVQVTRNEQPLAGELVHFAFTSLPAKAEGSTLSHAEVATDSDGIATVEVTIGSKPGIYRVAAFVPESHGDPILFTIHAHTPGWLLMLFFSLMGGLAMFLYGMMHMSDSMQKLGGHHFERIIERCTSNRFKAVFVGTIITAVIQSSSATTVMIVGLINGGMMTFVQSVGIILGANIGTTITAQIIAFKLTDYALFIIFLGFLLKFIARSKKKKLAGDMIIGFGLLFLGMKVMGDVTSPLRTYQPFIDLLLQLENPLYGVLAGALFTTMIQSSSASTGVYIALAFQGLITLDAAIPLIFGANIGTCTTALLACIGARREAKRAALAHVLFNGIKVCAFLPFIAWYGRVIYAMSPHPEVWSGSLEQISQYTPRMIANAHTLAKIIAVLVALPFTGHLAKLVMWLMPITEKEKTLAPKFLHKDLLKYPETALRATKNEVLHMGEYAQLMLKQVITVMANRKPEGIEEIALEDENINVLYKEIRPYIAQISQHELDPEESLNETEIIIVAEELENFGDVISKSLISSIEKFIEYGLSFSDSDWNHIVDFHGRITKSLDTALEVFQNGDLEKARHLVATKEEIALLYKALHVVHLQKHRSGVTETIQLSTLYLNMMADFRQLYTLATHIAQAVIDRQDALVENN